MDPKVREILKEWLQRLNVILDDAQWNQLKTYGQSVEEYNKKVNVTSDIGDDLFLRHIADGMAIVPILRRFFPSPPCLLDLGAGAGFIGISLKIVWPEVSVTLMESSYRKFQFLNWIVAHLKLKDARVVWDRAPERIQKSDLGEQKFFDVVLARAVAPLRKLLPLAATFVKPENGFLAAFQTDPPSTTEPGLKKAMESTHARLYESASYRLPLEYSDRTLALFQYRPDAQISALGQRRGRETRLRARGNT